MGTVMATAAAMGGAVFGLKPALAQTAQQLQAAPAWPELQGGAAHLGAAPGDEPSSPLKLAWRARPEGDARMSSAVLAPGLAVTTGATRMFGFDPATGKVLWDDVERAEGPLSPPAIDPPSRLLVFTEGGGPRDSAVVAVTLDGRSRRWRTALEDISRGGPSISRGVVFVGSRSRFVYAVDLETGTLRWKKRLEASIEVAPAVSGGNVYVTTENSANGQTRLYALAAATGKTLWSYSPKGVAVGVSSATVGGGSVFVGFGDYEVRALDARTGEVRWSAPVRSFFSFHGSLAFAGGDVYALDVAGGVYRFDGGNGKLRWDFQFPAYASWSAPLVLGRAVYVGLDDGTIAGIDRTSGHLVWETRLTTGPVGSFVPAAPLLLSTTNSQRGALVGFGHDPARALLDQPSPTTLHLPRALLNFVASFVVVLGLVFVLFRWVIRPRPVLELADVAGAEGARSARSAGGAGGATTPKPPATTDPEN